MNKLIYKALALAVGLLFIFSGLVKVNDPIGTAIKLEEYFDVFSYDIAGFFHFFIPLALPLAILLTVLEVVLGVALIVGFFRKITLWILLYMILFFTFLTFYSAYFNKVTDCGCFGDAVKLTPWQSFWKDIVLLISIITLIYLEKGIEWVHYHRTKGVVFVVLSLVISSFIAWAALRYLPPLDFRAYKVGSNIPELMKGSEPCRYVYVMEKDGATMTYTEYPTEPGLTLLEMNPANPEKCMAKITDFSVLSVDGEDYTTEALTGKKALIIVHNTDKIDRDGLAALVKRVKTANSTQPMVLTSASEGMEQLSSELLNKIPYYYVDATVLKTMVRSNPGLILLDNGMVKGKWHYNRAEHIELP